MITETYREQRTHKGNRVEAIRVKIEGGISQQEIDALKAEHPGYTNTLEHYLTIFKPVADAAAVEEEKNAVILSILTVVSDATASKFVPLFPELKQDGALIRAGTRIQWQGMLKRAAVDLHDTAQHTPEAAPTLWEDIAYFDGYRIIPEVITATLAFAKNEVGYWPPDEGLYRAKSDGTVWTPTAYPDAWKRLD